MSAPPKVTGIGLKRVHDDVVYNYSRLTFALGGGALGSSTAAAAAAALLPPPRNEEPPAQRAPLDEEIDEFISLEDIPTETAAPAVRHRLQQAEPERASRCSNVWRAAAPSCCPTMRPSSVGTIKYQCEAHAVLTKRQQHHAPRLSAPALLPAARRSSSRPRQRQQQQQQQQELALPAHCWMTMRRLGYLQTLRQHPRRQRHARSSGQTC